VRVKGVANDLWKGRGGMFGYEISGKEEEEKAGDILEPKRKEKQRGAGPCPQKKGNKAPSLKKEKKPVPATVRVKRAHKTPVP